MAAVAVLIAWHAAAAVAAPQTPTAADAPVADVPVPEPPAETPAPRSHLLTDIKDYFTAPLRWNARDWAWFGGAAALVGVAHHYDGQVRTHFVSGLAPGQTINKNDLQDAIPTAVVLGGTWAFATLSDSPAGRLETWTMFEAAGLSTVTVYAFKYALARQRPDQTGNSNEWFKSGGQSFPSEHATAAFAIGTVLAESGNEDYRWLRRVLGYGLGIATSYERLKHNAHWLSDTVAGAALGAATANFTMKRNYGTPETAGNWEIAPTPGGLMLTYRLILQ